MRYENVKKAIFLNRPNRFVAEILLDGVKNIAHVKNTGRCRELLVPGATVYVTEQNSEKRKTKYDLIAVEKKREKNSLLINMDSQAPNAVFNEWLPCSGLFSDKLKIKREVKFASSRFDFFVRDGMRRAFFEVKGVTLEENGVARFPDAPTARGVKHLQELVRAKNDGFEAYLVFVIQMKEVESFLPNEKTDPVFAEALREAKSSGVRILALDCRVRPDSLILDQPVLVEC